MEAAETRYARSGGACIACRVVGRGPVELVLPQGGFSHVELQPEEPPFARFLRRLASLSRLVVLDVRGAGLSDRTMHLPALEDQVDDVLAVLGAAGCARAAVLGLGQGGGLASLLPRRTAWRSGHRAGRRTGCVPAGHLAGIAVFAWRA